MRWKLARSFALLVAAMVAGCAENKLTRHNYDTIIEGKSNKDEVELTLGKAAANRGDQWEYENDDESLSVVFYFDDKGYVTRKEWIDADEGTWEGAAPGIDRNPEGKKTSEGTSNMTLKKD
jgi:hypothetical protein